MDKNRLQNELFDHLLEKANTSEQEKIKKLAENVLRAKAVRPPDELWNSIQQRISQTRPPASQSFFSNLRAIFSAPLVPALAAGVVAITVGAFFLLNQATPHHQISLRDLSHQQQQSKGDAILAKGLQIKNFSNGSISLESGPVDKIVMQSGSWRMALEHDQLAKPVQFIFPGGAIDPLGTAFEINIDPQHTLIKLTQGKIRLWENAGLPSDSPGANWSNREISAPNEISIASRPVNTQVELVKPIVEKKKLPTSKFSRYVGASITIELKNGDRLTGNVRRAANGIISLAAPAGLLTIREADIVKITGN
jgi:hypothetical protein